MQATKKKLRRNKLIHPWAHTGKEMKKIKNKKK